MSSSYLQGQTGEYTLKKERDEEEDSFHDHGKSQGTLSGSIEQILRTIEGQSTETIESIAEIEKRLSEFRKTEKMPVLSENCDKFIKDIEEEMNNYEFEKSQTFQDDLKEIHFLKYTNPKRYKWDRPEKFLSYCKKLEELDSYESYKNYLGINIHNFKENFKNWLRKEIVSNSTYFSSQLIVNTGDILTNDPLDLFQKRAELSPEQKEVLFQIFNSSDRAIKYAYTLRRPESRKLRIIKLFEVLMDHFIEVIENKNERELFNALLDNDKEKFYKNSFVNNHRKDIYELLEKHEPLFFYEEEIRTTTCPQKADIDLRFKLRKFIHEKNFGFELYEPIEEIFMSNNLIDLWKIKISNKDREELIEFYQKEDKENNYDKILSKKVYTKIKVKAELEKILIELNLKDLSIDTINKIIHNFVENGFFMKEYFSQYDFRRLNEAYKKSEVCKDFSENFLMDVEFEKEKMRKELIYTIVKLPDLSFDLVCEIIEQIVNKCDIESLTDSNDLSFNQKKFLSTEIRKIKQLEELKNCYEKTESKIKKDKWKDELSEKFSVNEALVLMNFYPIYGDIQLTQNKKILEAFPQSLQKLVNDKKQAIFETQEKSENYQNFRKSFITIFDRKYELIKEELCHFFETDMNEDNVSLYQENLKNETFNIEDLEQHEATKLRGNESYTKYTQFATAKKYLEAIREKIKFENFIFNLSLWDIAPNINKEKRKSLRSGLIAEGLEFLKKTHIIENEEKENLKKIINVFNKQYEIKKPVAEESAVSDSPLNRYSSPNEKKMDRGEAFNKLLEEFQAKTEFILPDLTIEVLENNLKIDSFSNSDEIKKFVKAIGVQGLKNVNGIKNFIEKSKEELQRYLDIIFSEEEKIESPVKKNEIIPMDEQAQDKVEVSIEILLEQLKNCSEIAKSLNEKRLINTLKKEPNIYESEEKLNTFFQNCGVKSEDKFNQCSFYFREKQEEIERVIQSLS